jgi:hypothetical protein
MLFYAITLSVIFTNQQLKLNPLDLTDCDLVFGAVVKFGGPGRLMRSHLLGMLEPASTELEAASIGQIRLRLFKIAARLKVSAVPACVFEDASFWFARS